MNGLFGLVHQPYQERPAAFPQVKLQHRLIAELKELDTQMIFSGLEDFV